MAEQQEDFSSLPLTERATHKLWKVRKEAYEEAAKQFEKSPDESDACFTPWMMDPYLWKKVVSDANVAAQQEGIAALCNFLQYGGSTACLRTRSHVIGPLVEKCLASTRAATKTKAQEVLLWFVELDTPGPVMEELIPFLNHKMPKLIAATLAAITAIYAAFGAKTVDPKPVLKVFPKVFGHADKNVRAESTKLAIELYKWLKDAMKPMFFGELKPVQQKELEDQFEKVKGETPKQERLLKSQQEAAAAAEAAGEDAMDETPDEPEEVDAFDLAEPVDISASLPDNFDELIASSKWKERKEAVDALVGILNVPRIKEGNYDNIVRALAKCMKDANVAVVTVAANCIELMATGMRKGFAKYKSTVLNPVMERLKEKKQSVVDALAKALDAIFISTSLADCMEDIAEMTKNKNPNVKLESIRFLVRCLRETKDFPSKPEQKQIADTAAKLLTESSAPLRDAGAEALGTLMKIIGERAMSPYLDGLDDIRKNKIKEFSDQATVKAKEKPKPKPPPPAAAPAAKPAARKAPGARPGLKAPGGLKKPASSSAAPAAAAPPAAAPSAAKPAPRAGGLRLQKKPAAPAKTPTPVEDEPPAPPAHAAPPSRLGLGRGLAGRALNKEPPAPAAPRIDPGISAAEKAELEALRAERERWEKAESDWKTEKQRLLGDLSDLQLQNAQLIEEHTRDGLAMRAKEAQLVRTKADWEFAQEEAAKLKREVERLKRELQRTVRSASPAPSEMSVDGLGAGMGNGGMYNGGYGGGERRVSASRASHRLSYAASSMSDDRMEGIERTGSGLGTGRERAMSPGTGGGSGRQSVMSGGGGDSIESWKRAAEVTSQLKMRIEQMKAKQGMSRHSASERGGY